MQIERHRDGERRVTQVTDVCGLEGETVILNDIFQFDRRGRKPDGGLHGHYQVNRARPSFHQRLVYFGLDRAWNAAFEEAGAVSRLLLHLSAPRSACWRASRLASPAIMREQARRRHFRERLAVVAAPYA